MFITKIIPYLGRGIGHEKAGVPCQDALFYCSHENGNRIMALSDGAGQARFAEEAANLTVRGAADFFGRNPLGSFRQLPEEERVGMILQALRARLQEHPSYSAGNAAEFSATLLFVVTDGTCILFGHLGDGAIYAANRQNELAFQSEPENASARRTWFVVSGDAEEHLRLRFLDAGEISGAVILSDGPYPMFRNRGRGKACVTALELIRYVREGRVQTRENLRDALNKMTAVPIERMDDWSVAIYAPESAPDSAGEAPPAPVSMLREEEEKYGVVPSS